MAKQAELQEQPEPEAGLEKGSRKKVVVIALVTLLLLGGGMGAWLLVSGSKEHEAKHKPAPAAPPVFVTLEPFVVNLAGDAQHYVQVGIDLKIADSTVPDRIKEHMPEIRNAVLLLLSAKTAEDLGTLDGKHTLRREMRAAINTVLGIDTPTASPAPAERAARPTQPGVGEAHAASPPAAAPEVNQTRDEAARAAAAESGREGVLEILFTSFVIQ